MYQISSFVMLISLLYKVIRIIWKIPNGIGIVSKCLMVCLTCNSHRNLLSLDNVLSRKAWLRGCWPWTVTIHWYSPSRLRRIIVLMQPVSGWNLSFSLLNLRDTLDQGLLNILNFFVVVKINKQKSLTGLIPSWGWTRNTLKSWNFPFNLFHFCCLCFVFTTQFTLWKCI